MQTWGWFKMRRGLDLNALFSLEFALYNCLLRVAASEGDRVKKPVRKFASESKGGGCSCCLSCYSVSLEGRYRSYVFIVKRDFRGIREDVVGKTEVR